MQDPERQAWLLVAISLGRYGIIARWVHGISPVAAVEDPTFWSGVAARFKSLHRRRALPGMGGLRRSGRIHPTLRGWCLRVRSSYVSNSRSDALEGRWPLLRPGLCVVD